MSKEDFKRFVRSNPNLIKYVNQKEKTWQELYEMYDIYGESSNIWDNIKAKEEISTNKTSLSDTSLKDIFNIIKKVDLESVRKGAEGLQKAITLFQDLGKHNVGDTYQARPLYQHFED